MAAKTWSYVNEGPKFFLFPALFSFFRNILSLENGDCLIAETRTSEVKHESHEFYL